MRTLDDYDASAWDTIERGTYFEFVDEDTREPRVGYYDRWTERLTVLDVSEEVIHAHFRCPARHVEGQIGSTYT